MGMMHNYGISLKMKDNHCYIGTCLISWFFNGNEYDCIKLYNEKIYYFYLLHVTIVIGGLE